MTTNSPDEFVVAKVFWSVEEAHLAKNRLESEGIHAALGSADSMATLWLVSNSIGGVKLLVQESDFDRAAEILDLTAADVTDVDLPLDVDDDENVVEENDREDAESAEDFSAQPHNGDDQNPYRTPKTSGSTASDVCSSEGDQKSSKPPLDSFRRVKQPIIWVFLAPMLVSLLLPVIYVLLSPILAILRFFRL